jgi:hypothetical protein
MAARRALEVVNGSASAVFVKPLVVMAARVLGPGPTRLKLVRLAHKLGHEAPSREDPAPVQPTTRAA